MQSTMLIAKKRSSLFTVVIPTLIFLACFIGTPFAAVMVSGHLSGFIIFIGLLLGFGLGLVVSVITYRKVYALSDLSVVKLSFRGSLLVQQRGRKEKLIDFAGEHFSEIEVGISPTGAPLAVIEIDDGKNFLRIAGMNYGYERAAERFPDGRYIGNFPISPFEGMSAIEVDAVTPEAMSFIDEMILNLWEYRNFNVRYRYHKSLPWDERIEPKFSVVRVIQGDSLYQENLSLIEEIQNSALYTVEESYNYLFINRDYLMVCPSKKIDVTLITRIFPLGIFSMHFKKELRSGPIGSDHWEYIKIRGIDEKGNPHTEMVAFSVYYMKDFYKAKVMKNYLLKRNLVVEN